MPAYVHLLVVINASVAEDPDFFEQVALHLGMDAVTLNIVRLALDSRDSPKVHDAQAVVENGLVATRVHFAAFDDDPAPASEEALARDLHAVGIDLRRVRGLARLRLLDHGQPWPAGQHLDASLPAFWRLLLP